MNRILELSSKSSKGGRRKIRMVLLTLHKKDEKNLNGISWNEEYVLNNLDSIKGIPICASFVDSELKDIPLDHGYTETVEIGDGKSEPLFNNSECCGVIEDAKIEDLEINGETKRVLVGYGYLFYQRYKNFCDYLKENILLSDVKSSIEIVGKNGGSIIYDGGYNKELRYPQVFDFSATAILGGVVKEADENCYVLEVAQKQEKLKEEKKNMEFNMDELKSVIKSTLAEINSEKKSHDDEVSELNNKITELNSQIEAKDADIAARDAQIAELNAKVEQMEKDMKKKDDEKEDLEEVTKAKAYEKLSEMEAALKDFSDEEKEVAKEDIKKLKDEINACKKKSELNNVTSEINSIKSKICMEIVAKQKQAESEARISEQNSETKIEDIFSEVCSEKYVDDDEEVNIF